MIALISDIHGNYTALMEVIKRIDALGIKEIYSLGDTVGYYTQINECCEELQTRNILSIMGNHDWYLAGKSFCPRSKSVNDCLVYQRKIITTENRNWLENLPLFRYVEAYDLSLVHGGWANPIDEYLEPSAEYFAQVEGKFFASGHSHIQQLHIFNDKIYCNPGSVGQPRDENPMAAFATFDGAKFELHRVEYDIEKVGKLMDAAGYSGYYYGCLRTGSRRLTW